MSEILTKATEIFKKEQESVVTELLTGMADLQDTLICVAEDSKGLTAEEIKALRFADVSLISFCDASPNFLTASPRSVRDEDRRKILPGQHAGVFLQFGLLDGTILRINFWGGLRITSTQDLKDKDLTLSTSHTRRTEDVLEQPTDFNWQLSYPRSGPFIDSWMRFNPNNKGSFQQSSISVDGEKVDCRPTILSDDSRFPQLKKEIFEPIGKIIKLVPNSV